MASSEVRTTYTMNTAGVRQQLDDVQSALVKLGGNLNRLGNAAEAAGKKGKDAFGDKAAGMLAKHAAALVSVNAAVRVVRGAYGEWLSAMDQVGKRSQELADQVIKNIAMIGDQTRAKEIGEFLQNVPEAGPEAALEAYKAISGAATQTGLPRRKELVAAVAPLAAAGVDVTQVGSLAGELAEMAPRKTAGDVADLALKLSQVSGREATKLSSPQFMRRVKAEAARGVPLEQTLAEGVIAIQAGESPERPRRLTAAQKAEAGTLAAGFTEAQQTNLASTFREAMADWGPAGEAIARSGREEARRKTPEMREAEFLGRQGQSYLKLVTDLQGSLGFWRGLNLYVQRAATAVGVAGDPLAGGPGETMWTGRAKGLPDYPVVKEWISTERELKLAFDKQTHELEAIRKAVESGNRRPRVTVTE